MILSNTDTNKVPTLGKYLFNDFGHLVSNTKIIDALVARGEFKDVGGVKDTDRVKQLIKFGSGPTIKIDGNKGVRFDQFNQFPISISVNVNMAKAFEIKDDMEGNNTFLNELVFLTTGNGHRIFQIGLKLLELLIQGNLLVSKDTNVVPDDNVKALKVIKDRVTAFENDVYGGVDTTGATFF